MVIGQLYRVKYMTVSKKNQQFEMDIHGHRVALFYTSHLTVSEINLPNYSLMRQF